MNILVAGINGFAGHHLVRELHHQGMAVIGTGRASLCDPAIRSCTASYYQCDLTNVKEVSKLPLESIDGIINLAGLAQVGASFDNPAQYMSNNVAVQTVIAEAISKTNKAVRILAISTGAVYDNRQPMPLNENSRHAADASPYALSKIAMEGAMTTYRKRGMDVLIVRPFNHIGPDQETGFLLPDLYEKLSEAKKDNKPMYVGNLTTSRDFTDVRDVVKAYAALIKQPTLLHHTYNVCSGTATSGEEILQTLKKAMGAENIKSVVDESQFRPSDAPMLYGDNSRIIEETGWKPAMTLKQTVDDFVQSKQEGKHEVENIKF